MRFVGALFTLLLLAGCGGGGGTVPDGGPNPPPPGGTDARIGELLEACLPDALSDGSEWLQAMQAVLAGGGSTAGVMIEPGGVQWSEEPGAAFMEIRWSWQPTGEPAPVGGGSFVFEDSGALPTQPFSANDRDTIAIGEDIDTLGSLLSAAAAGTRMVIAYAPRGGTLSPSTMGAAVGVGGSGATDGTLTVTVGGCVTSLAWDGIPASDLTGNFTTTFPSGTWDVVLGEGGDQLVGTLLTDGTRSATATVALNGGGAGSWGYDLVTGQATAP